MKWLYLFLAVAAVAILAGIYASLQPERDQESRREADASVALQEAQDSYNAMTAAAQLDPRMQSLQSKGVLSQYFEQSGTYQLFYSFASHREKIDAGDAALIKALHQCAEPFDGWGYKGPKAWSADPLCVASHSK